MVGKRDHLSRIQDACTGDEPEFVMGEVYGVREWFMPDIWTIEVGEVFPLYGHFNKAWDPTHTTVAVCHADNASSTLVLHPAQDYDVEDIEALIRREVDGWLDELFTGNLGIDPQTAELHLAFSPIGVTEARFMRRDVWRPADWLLDDPFMPTREIQIPMKLVAAVRTGSGTVLVRITGKKTDHPAGHPTCTCGIYAYHDWASLNLSGVPRERSVFGLVKAYGRVTVGSKGFRAQKADVLAFTRPWFYVSRASSGVHERVQATLDAWSASGIALLDGVPELRNFAEHGGYLRRPGTEDPPTE